MDISSFSDENFDTKEWINNILKSLENQDKKENHTLSLIMKLQLYVQQVNSSLEQTSQQILQSLPKIKRDTQTLQQDILLLKEKLAIIKEEIVNIKDGTGQSIKIIQQLDEIKSKLTDAKQGLHESDNWAVLANDLEEVFDSRNVESIATKLLSMQQSLKLLVNVADYEDRKLQLEGLKNRLEAIASPSVVQAFTSNNTEQSVTFAKIFSSIGRLQQLLKYYNKCQKDVLLKKWNNQLEIEQDESLTQWIHNYYDVLLSNWHTQTKWFNLVFPNQNTNGTLINIYIDVFTNLDPSINKCTDAALKQTNDKLGLLTEIKQITKQFSANLIAVIDPGHKTQKDKFLPLLQAIYGPLVEYVGKYAAYEQANLIQQLNGMNCIKDELSNTVQSLGLSIPSIIDGAYEAKQRCKQFTENCGYCGLLIALRAYFVAYADQYKVALRQIDRRRTNAEDWNLFQLSLSLLQNAGEFSLKLQRLEKDVTSTVYELNQTDTVTEYKNLLLNVAERKEYEALVKCVMEGTRLSLLDHVIVEFNKLCSDTHHTMYQAVFAPIAVQLQYVQNEKSWQSVVSSTELPDYSYSPQEYITQIGQYLMTLPQHLEPFLFRENPALSCALKASDQEYANAQDVEGALADVLLGIIARGTCQAFCDHILSISQLSHSASKQLALDINYLGNILSDLGLTLNDGLTQLSSLLKLPPDQYQTQSAGYSARYVAAVRQMRNITSLDKQQAKFNT